MKTHRSPGSAAVLTWPAARPMKWNASSWSLQSSLFNTYTVYASWARNAQYTDPACPTQCFCLCCNDPLATQVDFDGRDRIGSSQWLRISALPLTMLHLQAYHMEFGRDLTEWHSISASPATCIIRRWERNQRDTAEMSKSAHSMSRHTTAARTWDRGTGKRAMLLIVSHGR